MKKIWRYLIARLLIQNGYQPLDIERFDGVAIYNFIHGKRWDVEKKTYAEVK